MKTFGELALKVAGSSAGMEGMLKKKTSGGFTSNTCKGMNALGVKIFVASAWGHPLLENVFKPLFSKDSIEIFNLFFCRVRGDM